MPKHQTAVRPEREGYCATCSCGWLRWSATRKGALDYGRAHKPRPRKED